MQLWKPVAETSKFWCFSLKPVPNSDSSRNKVPRWIRIWNTELVPCTSDFFPIITLIHVTVPYKYAAGTSRNPVRAEITKERVRKFTQGSNNSQFSNSQGRLFSADQKRKGKGMFIYSLNQIYMNGSLRPNLLSPPPPAKITACFIPPGSWIRSLLPHSLSWQSSTAMKY